MASSVSSERAFSQGGITISKCHNRLKGDIVEALQCLKCLIRRDLMFREPSEMESEDKLGPVEDEEGWDCFLGEDEDEVHSDMDLD